MGGVIGAKGLLIGGANADSCQAFVSDLVQKAEISQAGDFSPDSTITISPVVVQT